MKNMIPVCFTFPDSEEFRLKVACVQENKCTTNIVDYN